MTGAPALPSRADSMAWAADGAAHLRGLMTRMGDDAFRGPSLLPEWTRAHVLTHIARNADAMINLARWAKSGVETPAYASREQRDADIEAGAGREPAAIRADVIDSSDRLADAVRALPEAAWTVQVRSPQGLVPAAAIPWGRAREVWIHAVDLDVGASFADMPAPMLTVLVGDVASTLGTRPSCPGLRIEDVDGGLVLDVGPGPDGAQLGTVRGNVADLAAWLLGRSSGTGLRTADGRRPDPLPGWL